MKFHPIHNSHFSGKIYTKDNLIADTALRYAKQYKN